MTARRARLAPLGRAAALFGARDGAAYAALLAMSATFAVLPLFVTIALAARWLEEPDVLYAAERGVFALWPKLIARPVAQAIEQASEDLSVAALPLMALAFLVLAGNALDVLRRGLERFYAPSHAPAKDALRQRFRAFGYAGVAAAAAFGAALLVAAMVDLPPTAPAVEPATPPPGAGPLLFAAQTLGGLLLVTASLLVAHTRLARGRLSARAAAPGIAVSVVAWIASVNLLALYQTHVAPPQTLYGPFAAAFATLLFFFVGAAALLYGAALNATLLAES
ncbi:YhjD/YihY/BrkB family envelope integrity protein [Salinarimonas sp.]|uniref:YhjD/YihY/BrkB family envelope integrity protein n=1 Tax=Salinarimonas sp. TaxID=2766526 RepID=UPI0032D98C1F